jgi:hypothetical protein
LLEEVEKYGFVKPRRMQVNFALKELDRRKVRGIHEQRLEDLAEELKASIYEDYDLEALRWLNSYPYESVIRKAMNRKLESMQGRFNVFIRFCWSEPGNDAWQRGTNY